MYIIRRLIGLPAYTYKELPTIWHITAYSYAKSCLESYRIVYFSAQQMAKDFNPC